MRDGLQYQCGEDSEGFGDVAHFGGEKTRRSRRHHLVERPQPGCGETETDSPPVFDRNYRLATLEFSRLIGTKPKISCKY